MKKFRTLLLGLLCFAISIQGFAHTAMPEKPCPMQQSDAVAAITPDADHDCCNDADTAARTGKVCKTGQECPVGGIGPIMSFQAASPTPMDPLRLVFRARAMFDSGPSGVWRPPTLI